jgi:indoleamine 2,3-dioxygenase
MIPQFTDGFFCVSAETGFLPVEPPMVCLPEQFIILQNILDKMPAKDNNGESGYLARNDGSLEHSVNKVLPNYIKHIKLIGDDIKLVAALYRGYCFLASAYLLEPAHIKYRETGHYGVGRNRLPRNVAEPLIFLANRLDVFPWLEYSYGYSLGNYVKLDNSGDLTWDNLKMANSFTGQSDECGFIMDHVDINRHTPDMIKYIDIIASLIYKCDKVELVELNTYLSGLVDTLKLMNASRRDMWKASRSENYNDFRAYIMGITGNDTIFPDGVYYGDETTPRKYRGQSGSQDTIIPFLDITFGINKHYPDNMLTKYLLDMRKYRPRPFRDLLDWCEQNFVDFVTKIMECGDFITYRFLFEIYREIHRFRNGHWQFVQKYIMSNTKYPIATGGTPITTWIPNQIVATLDAMKNVLDNFPKEPIGSVYLKSYYTMLDEYNSMRKLIDNQIDELSNPEYDSDKVFELNNKYKLADKPAENI